MAKVPWPVFAIASNSQTRVCPAASLTEVGGFSNYLARGAEHMAVRKRGGEHNVLSFCVLVLMGKTCSLHEN